MFSADLQTLNVAPDWLTSPSLVSDWVKAADSVEREKLSSEEDPVLLGLLRQAKLFQVVARLRQCGICEQKRRCRCGAELESVRRYCRQYICTPCQRRKAYRISIEVSEALRELRKNNPGLKVFKGTFTLPSCTEENLRGQIDRLNKAFTKLLRRAALKPYVLGAGRFIEITFNRETGMFNPHLNVLVAVRATYMSKGYLSLMDLLVMWQRATNCPRASQITFKIIKTDLKKSLSIDDNAAGWVRYSMKPIEAEKWTSESLGILHKAIRNRRLCEFLGGFKLTRRQQKQNKARCVCEHCLQQKAV